MIRSKQLFVFIILLIPFICAGQSSSTNMLSYANFLQLVKQNHPLAKKANLIMQSADANTLIARGSFDPKIFYEFNNKFYNAKNYYQLGEGGFKIPTWFGIELKGGFEQNQGELLNPENLTPKNGLVYSQISLPLMQGFVIDERRATLKQAKLFQELSNYEKINAINELLYNAGKAYWDWQLSYSNLQIYQMAVSLAKERYDANVRSSALGDKPAIDTVEAVIQLQDRILNMQQALMEYKTKTLFLSGFLWLENDTPIELTENTIPDRSIEEIESGSISFTNYQLLDSLINNHPSLKIYDFKLKQLAIEKKFKSDKLKPILNINYNPIYNADNIILNFQNNYKWGLAVGFPIFLRKERGDLQLTKIKINNTMYENANKRNELVVKAKATVNELNTYNNQIETYIKNVNNYERLWKYEKRLFSLGESSLFMINAREVSYLNAKIKYNDIIYKNNKAVLDAEYTLGLLNSLY